MVHQQLFLALLGLGRVNLVEYWAVLLIHHGKGEKQVKKKTENNVELVKDFQM